MKTKILSPLRRDGYKAGMIMMLIALSTMMLTTACSSEDDALNNTANTENTINKGYALPVTVNVTREGDAGTRATYTDNGNGTGSLAFSAGDKLFVSGTHTTAGQFAGELTWQSGGTFSGTISTANTYSGTAEELLSAASPVSAILLPAGYNNYDFLTLNTNNGYDATISTDLSKTFALTKAAAVEQFSLERTSSYSNGFTLYPSYGILNFTITGLTPNTDVNVTFSDYTPAIYGNTMGGTVHTDGSGNATFAVAVYAYSSKNIQTCTLYVNGNPITLVSTSKPIDAGKIYNITRSALTYPIALSAVTSSYVGSVVTTDGNVYATVAAASAASETAVAVIAYVGTAGSVDASSASYKGLAIALSDANSGSKCKWAESNGTCVSQTNIFSTALGFKNGITCTSTLTGDGHTHAAATAAASNNGTAAPTSASGWFMPSMGQWNLIVQGLASKKAGSAITTDLAEGVENNTYKADNLNSVITDAGGTGLEADSYWTSTEEIASGAWVMHFWWGYGTWFAKTTNRYVRSVIAF